jgi:hypothetical protein
MEIPIGTVITSIVSIIAIVITSRLAYGRSNKEKLWDERRRAYGVILSALAAAERICDEADDYIEHQNGYFESKTSRAHGAKIAEHMKTADNRFSDDYLILSDAFITLYGELNDKRRAVSYQDELPPDEHERFAETLRTYRTRLMAQARSEMNAQNRWGSFLGSS